jgi:hypothetical protein
MKKSKITGSKSTGGKQIQKDNKNENKGVKKNTGNSAKGDFGEDPEKKVEIGDDPDGTQKKIPRMSNL